MPSDPQRYVKDVMDVKDNFFSNTSTLHYFTVGIAHEKLTGLLYTGNSVLCSFAWLYPLDLCMSSMYELYLDPHPNTALGSLSPIQAVNPRNHYTTFIYI